MKTNLCHFARTMIRMLALLSVTSVCRGGDHDVYDNFMASVKIQLGISMNYKIVRPTELTETNVEYMTSGGWYVFKIHDKDNKQNKTFESAVSFDGQRYFSLLPSGTLVVGRNPRVGANGSSVAYIQSCFLQHPLFSLFGPAHVQAKGNEFFLPNILGPDSWVASGAALKGSFSAYEAGKTYTVQKANGDFTYRINFPGENIYPDSVTLSGPRNYMNTTRVKSWYTVKDRGGGSITIPSRIETWCRAAGDANVETKLVKFVEIDTASIKIVGNIDVAQFRIPTILANTLIDGDIGGKVHLGR